MLDLSRGNGVYGQVDKGWVRVESQGVEEPDVLAGNMAHSH